MVFGPPPGLEPLRRSAAVLGGVLGCEFGRRLAAQTPTERNDQQTRRRDAQCH